jgi:hypothetical protein
MSTALDMNIASLPLIERCSTRLYLSMLWPRSVRAGAAPAEFLRQRLDEHCEPPSERGLVQHVHDPGTGDD